MKKKEKAPKAPKPDKKLRRKKIKLFFKELFLLLIGSTLTAIAVKYIYDPAGLVTGGVTGLSIIARSVCSRYFNVDFPLWLGSLVFNLPLCLKKTRKQESSAYRICMGIADSGTLFPSRHVPASR